MVYYNGDRAYIITFIVFALAFDHTDELLQHLPIIVSIVSPFSIMAPSAYGVPAITAIIP